MRTDYFLGLTEEGFHRIVYSVWGETANTRPIICVHGLTRHRHDFDALAAYLSTKNRLVYCPDMAGRGDSDWLKHAHQYTYEQYLADASALIARTGQNAVDWIGTSMGGLIGMILASLPRTPIRALILNDIGPYITKKALFGISKHMGNQTTFNTLDEAKTYFKTIYQSFGIEKETDWDTFTQHNLRQTNTNLWTLALDPNVKITASKSKLAWQTILHPHRLWDGTLFDVDLWAIWQKVTCPVLVIRGAQSEILPSKVIEKMRSTHAKVDVVEIKNAGHAPALLTLEQHEVIYAWLKKHS